MDNRPIGVFDSGLGGLTVLQSCRDVMPKESFIYLGDTARYPYGTKSAETIRRYAIECAKFLEARDIKLLIVACNTASSYAIPDLVELIEVPVIGTIEPAVSKAIDASTSGRIGVIGTEATISVGVYERALHAFRPTLNVSSYSCPLFVPIVENGLFTGSVVDGIVEMHLKDLKSDNVDSLILGCTHYPFLLPSIQRFLGDGVRMITCSDAVADGTKKVLERKSAEADPTKKGGVEYFVTDEVQRFSRLGSLLLKEDIKAKKVELKAFERKT